MWLVRRQSELVERRDPRAATLSPVAQYSFRRYPLWNAQAAVTEALYANVYVYACARARAQDLATLPIRVGADPDNPKDFDPNHPLAKLLGPAPGGPTLNLSARRLIAWTSMQFDITGRMSWEIAPPVTDRRDGVPFELWPLPASRLFPIHSQAGSQWFTEFEYQVNNYRKRLKPEQVLYYWRSKQDDFREPESLLEAARLNVSIAVMQDRYDYAFLVNDARPAAVVVHEEFARKTERNSFRRQFLNTHRGPDNAGKVAFVEASRDGSLPKDSLYIKQLGLSQRDAEFIERYENQIRAICVAFATPLSRLADSSRRTYANAERETKNYWRNAIHPQAVEMAEAFNVGLMPRMGDNNNVCWFDTTGIPELEPPRRYAVGDIPELIAAEVITQNEARHGLELPAVEGGDEFTQPPVAEPVPVASDPTRSVATLVADDSVILAALVQQVGSRVSALSDRIEAALRTRVAGKRGRQAETLSDLFDLPFWTDVAEVEFTDIVRSIGTVVAARDRDSNWTPQKLQLWSAEWGAQMAERWVQQWNRSLAIPVGSGIPPKVTIESAAVSMLWYSAVRYFNQGESAAETQNVQSILSRLQSGKITVNEAMAAL